MRIFHYFSRDKDKKTKFIFDAIAPIYSSFDKKLQTGFRSSSKILDREISIQGKSILDVGTGTGAWAATLHHFGPSKLHGIDFSENMLKEAKKNHPYIEFSNANAEDLSEFDDNTFDIVTASFVLHGIVQEKRKQILIELKRVSKKHVIIRDMLGKTPIFLKFLEFLEQSDYKHFKKNFYEELKENFKKLKAIPTKYGTGLYIAEK